MNIERESEIEIRSCFSVDIVRSDNNFNALKIKSILYLSERKIHLYRKLYIDTSY